nr:hypothetical protein [Tanacetum cinerariifolium]
MDMTIDQQVALDKALVLHASRLRIGKSNFQLRSDIMSKESTLQVVYDVLRLTPFYKAFLVTADVPKIYMQEFWATATVHHHSIHFKMNNKKRIVNLEYFREMLHICPRIPNQTFDELPFEEEILALLRYLRQGMYHKKNVDFAYFLWEDFVYQVEQKDSKKSNEMYYPRFTKVIINFFMTKDPSISKRNKFSTILPVELTNEDIRNSAAYKEYYAITSGAAPPKTKANVKKTQSSFDTTMPPPTIAGTRLLTSAKGKQPAKSSKAKGLSVLSEGPDVPTDEPDEEISLKSSDEDDDDVDDQSDVNDDDDDDQEDEDEQDDDDQDDNDHDQESYNDGDNFVHLKMSTHDEEAKDEESFDPIVQTPSQVENSDEESNDDESHGMNVGGDEGPNAEDDDEELYRDVNINLEGRDVQMIDVYTTQVLEDTHVTLTPVNPDGQQQSSSVSSKFVTSMLNPSHDIGIDSLFESTHPVDVPVTTIVVPLLVTAPTLPPPSIPMMSQVQQAPTPTPTTAPTNFSEFMQTNQFVGVVSSIPDIVDRYIDHWMNEVVKVAVQIQSDRLRDEAQAENELEAEVLTRSSNSSKTSYAVAADLSELELKNILIEKMESNKSIHRSDEQKNLYEALVDAYECDKIILNTYGDTVMLKRHQSTSSPKEKASKTTGKSTEGSKSHQQTVNKSAPAEEPMQTTQDLEEPLYQEFETGAADDQPMAEAS